MGTHTQTHQTGRSTKKRIWLDFSTSKWAIINIWSHYVLYCVEIICCAKTKTFYVSMLLMHLNLVSFYFVRWFYFALFFFISLRVCLLCLSIKWDNRWNDFVIAWIDNGIYLVQLPLAVTIEWKRQLEWHTVAAAFKILIWIQLNVFYTRLLLDLHLIDFHRFWQIAYSMKWKRMAASSNNERTKKYTHIQKMKWQQQQQTLRNGEL